MSSRFLDSTKSIVSIHGQRLSALFGQRLTNVWVAWDTDDDSWFADEPVVVTFGNISLAIVFWQSHEVALEWDAIDLSKPPNWFGCYEDLNLEWRPCQLAAIRTSVGHSLEDVILIENCETLQDLVEPMHPENVGTEASNWYPYALSFRFGDPTLTVFNALDENGLSDEIPVADYLRATSIRELIT